MKQTYVLAGILTLAAFAAVPLAAAEDYVVCQSLDPAGGTVCAGATDVRLRCATIDGEYIADPTGDCAAQEPDENTHIFVKGPAEEEDP